MWNQRRQTGQLAQALVKNTHVPDSPKLYKQQEEFDDSMDVGVAVGEAWWLFYLDS